MPRFLWLGLAVCALALSAALLFVRALDAKDLVEPESAAPAATLPSEALDLAHAESTADSARESIDVVRKVAAPPSTDRSQLAPQPRPRDFGQGQVVDIFDAGVIEVRVVRDHDGRPMVGVNVALAHEGGPQVQQTDSSGAVVFTNVEQGQAVLSAVLAGHARAVVHSSISRDSAHKNVELRLVVEREVVVRLRDPNGRTFNPAAWQIDGRAANRIGIRLDSRCGRMGSTFEAADVIQFSSRSAEHDLGPFAWRVRIQGAPDVCVHALLEEVIVGAGPLDPLATELEVRLDPVAIEAALAPVVLRVLAQVGDVPIAGALVEYDGGSKQTGLQTGVDGRVRVPMAAAPTGRLVVSARGYGPVKFAPTRPHLSEFLVRLPPGRRITGRVVDQDGEPLATARIELRAASGDAASAPSTRAVEGGRFELVDAAAVEYRVLASYSGNRVEVRADCRERDALDLEITIPLLKQPSSPTPR